ncbi:MAG: transporter substrate-binding domain-containing protein [Candidatus Nanopelagicales bacterium]|nr:transporter substrate-binding domain-containing protein [Candidatus Nanopelagicales bacterium]
MLAGCSQVPDAQPAAVPSATSTTAGPSPIATIGNCANENLTTRTAGQLTVAHSRATAPYFTDRTPADPVGFEVDVIDAIAAGLGFARTQIAWQSTLTRELTAPTTARFDLGIAQLEQDRSKTLVDFSDPYLVQTQVLIGRPDSLVNKVTDAAELSDASIGVLKGSSSDEYVTRVLGLDPVAYLTTDALKAALRDRHVSGIIVADDMVNLVLTTFTGDLTVVGQFPPAPDAATLHLSLPAGDPLRSCVDEVLARMSADGTLDELRAKWFAEGVDRIITSP